MTRTLTLFTRQNCHLCHVAHAELERVRGAHPFELAIIDLDAEAPSDKKAAYDHEVPVVELDGRKIMKYSIDEARLVRLLAGG
jgi:glutaredoxin